MPTLHKLFQTEEEGIIPNPFYEVNITLTQSQLRILVHERVSLVAQVVKKLPAMWETCVPSPAWEDALEEGMATHSSIHDWRIPLNRGA